MLRAPLEHRRHSQRGMCGRCRAVPPAVADRAQAARSGGNGAWGQAQERASGAHHDAIDTILVVSLGLVAWILDLKALSACWPTTVVRRNMAGAHGRR